MPKTQSFQQSTTSKFQNFLFFTCFRWLTSGRKFWFEVTHFGYFFREKSGILWSEKREKNQGKWKNGAKMWNYCGLWRNCQKSEIVKEFKVWRIFDFMFSLFWFCNLVLVFFCCLGFSDNVCNWKLRSLWVIAKMPLITSITISHINHINYTTHMNRSHHSRQLDQPQSSITLITRSH